MAFMLIQQSLHKFIIFRCLEIIADREMLFVGLLGGQPCPKDGDDRGEGVAQVVDRVQNDGDGAGEQAHHRLEGRQALIAEEPMPASHATTIR